MEIKNAVKALLKTRRDPATGEDVLAFVSDQLITLHPTKEWRFSELRTEITRHGENPSSGEADIFTFVAMPKVLRRQVADQRSS